MPYDPINHHRRSIRLKGHDYAAPGAYFVTICVHGRMTLFGEVMNEEMRLNPAGEMVWRWWREIGAKYPFIEPATAIVMPNHFHGILVIRESPPGATTIVKATTPGGATTPGRPHDDAVGAALRGRPVMSGCPDSHSAIPDHPIRCDSPNPTIGRVVGWFKTMTTNAYIHGVREAGWPVFCERLWQRNYYEHIIQDMAEWEQIATYIVSNPSLWERDKLNPSNPWPGPAAKP